MIKYISDNNRVWTHKHLVLKRTPNLSQMIKVCCEYWSVRCIKLYAIIMFKWISPLPPHTNTNTHTHTHTHTQTPPPPLLYIYKYIFSIRVISYIFFLFKSCLLFKPWCYVTKWLTCSYPELFLFEEKIVYLTSC